MLKLILLIDQNGNKLDSKYVSIEEYATTRALVRACKQSYGIEKKHKRIKKKEDHYRLDFYGLKISLVIPYD
jgi:hypothetical protein